MKQKKLNNEIKNLEKRIKGREETLEKLSKKKSNIKSYLDEMISKRFLGEFYSDKREELQAKEEEIVNKLKAGSDEEKLIVGKFLNRAGILRSCGGFGSYKNPTSCGSCHEGERNVHRFKLEDYVEFVGDRCYRIPSEVFENAREQLVEPSDKKKVVNLENLIRKKQLAIEELKSELKQKSENCWAYNKLDRSDSDYELVEKEMPDFIELMKNSGDSHNNVSFALANHEQGIGIILLDRWWDSGSAGCEYGINAVVFRDGKTKSQYFKYRDAYSSSGDAWHLRFKTAEIEKIHKTNLTVKLKSNDYEYSVSFDLAQKKQKKVKPSLDKKAQKEYLKHFEEEKVRLLKQHYKENALMADYISMWGVEGVTFSRGAGPSGRLVPYQESTIADEVVRADQGIGVVIVKAQIDHSASRGKQFEWVAYKITPQKTESLSRDCAYQYDMKHGKKIDMKASEMLLQYLN